MTTREIYEADYKYYSEFFTENPVSKYHWAATEIFPLTTYDDALDELFITKIVEVCKAILDRKTFEYISGYGENYRAYILVCNMLNHYGWIEWGTSIRGAWFQEVGDCRAYILESYEYGNVPFTEENMRILVDFLSETGDKKEEPNDN